MAVNKSINFYVCACVCMCIFVLANKCVPVERLTYVFPCVRECSCS